MADYSPYQQKIIKRYYNNFDSIQAQRLAELVTELFLAEGKKRDRLWGQAAESLGKLKFPQSRIDYLMLKRDPSMLAGILQEINK